MLQFSNIINFGSWIVLSRLHRSRWPQNDRGQFLPTLVMYACQQFGVDKVSWEYSQTIQHIWAKQKKRIEFRGLLSEFCEFFRSFKQQIGFSYIFYSRA